MGNKITADKVEFNRVDIGQQVKSPVFIHPKTFPIGSTLLICDYDYDGKHQEVRVLLPAHIFKMLTIRPRDGEFRDPVIIKVPVERKIAKNIEALKQYFKGAAI